MAKRIAQSRSRSGHSVYLERHGSKQLTLTGQMNGCAAQKLSEALQFATLGIVVTESGSISPSIFVVQTAEDRSRAYSSARRYAFGILDCKRRALNLIGNAGSQGLMRTSVIVMVHPFSKRALQMRFTQRYHIVQTLSPDRSN